MTEQLELEILKLVFDYYKKNKDVDLEFLIKVANAAVEFLDLDQYFGYLRLECDDIDSGTFLGAYYNEFKEIVLDFDKIEDAYTKSIPYLNFNDTEIRIFKYLTILRIFLHELIHVTQAKKCHEEPTSVEGLIYKRIFENNPKNTDITYYTLMSTINRFIARIKHKLTYYYDPAERIAEQLSSQMLINIFKQLDLDIKNLLLHEKAYLNNAYLRGYDKVDNPTKHYLYLQGLRSLWQEIEPKTQDLSINERLSLGLDVPYEILEELAEDSNDIRKRVLLKVF